MDKSKLIKMILEIIALVVSYLLGNFFPAM